MKDVKELCRLHGWPSSQDLSHDLHCMGRLCAAQVEYPHSNLTYRSLKLVPYAQLSWKSEVSAWKSEGHAGVQR
jgi:hypothetical protein